MAIKDASGRCKTASIAGVGQVKGDVIEAARDRERTWPREKNLKMSEVQMEEGTAWTHSDPAGRAGCLDRIQVHRQATSTLDHPPTTK